MKFLTIIVPIVLFLSAVSHPQVNRTIGDFEKEVSVAGLGGPRPFVGTFEFETFPKPLTPTRVYFTFEVNDKMYSKPDDVWVIRLNYHPKGVRMLSDTVYYWPGPHELGNQYNGYFEFVPLCSGKWDFTFCQDGAGWLVALKIAYTLDQDGNVIDIGKEPHVRGYNIVSTFFNEDSIYFTQRGIGPRELFKYNFVVKPLFRIGDTSTITYYLTALEDAPDGVDIKVNADNMQIISLPERISKSVFTGDTLILNIKVVPRSIRDEHLIIVNLKNLEKDTRDNKHS
ncbi:MAG: hypothetical protein PHU88_05735 [candidate division Zixibacteria bacterium]|nr:hypothetical protein [candidate division Zixibacteria bacterium]MDD5426580.1 hypothetical protein [candidate division Zixibacteria bacterium]